MGEKYIIFCLGIEIGGLFVKAAHLSKTTSLQFPFSLPTLQSCYEEKYKNACEHALKA